MISNKFESTIIVPAYNRGDIISETLNSLLNQTKPFHEVIVVDDGSSDNTHETLKKYGDSIRVVHSPNRGVQHARNIGASLATTEWITFCDSDDILMPEYTSIFEAFVRSNPQYDLLYSRFSIFRGEPWSTSSNSPGKADSLLQETPVVDGFYVAIDELLPKILIDQFLWPTGMSMRKDAFSDIGGYDAKFRHLGSEDLEFTLRAIFRYSTAICQQPLARMRRHEGNQSQCGLKQALGEAMILEHTLATQPACRIYQDRVRKSIIERRLGAMIGSYEKGDLALCRDVLATIPTSQLGIKGIAKKIIASLPEPWSSRMWKVSRRDR